MILSTVDEKVVPLHVAREAQRGVRLATRSAVYEVDAQQDPADPTLRDAMLGATEEQIRALTWRNDRDTALQASAALSPLGIPLASASIGGASYSVQTGSSGVPAPYLLNPEGGLCTAAYEILLEAGLIGASVGIVGLLYG